MERLYLIELFLHKPIIISILSIILLGILSKILFFLYKEKITIDDLKLNFDIKLLFLFIPIVLGINLLVFLFRIRNYGNQVKLAEVFNKIKIFFLLTSYLQILMTIILLIMIIINIILFLLIVKKNTFLFFCKINFFVINYLDEYPQRKDSIYEIFKQKYTSFFYKIKKIPRSIFIIFFGQRYLNLSTFIGSIYQFYGIIILFIVFFYEVIFNNFTLSKFYLVIPFILGYQIGVSIYHFCNLTYDLEENIICNYLYDDNLLLLNKEIYVASNGYEFTTNELEEIKLFISSDFDRKTFRRIYQEKNNKDPELC